MTKFKVGDWWRTRGGWYEQIVSVNHDFKNYPIQTTSHASYAHDGSYMEEGPSSEDLVQKMKPPVWEEDNDK